MSLRFKKKVEDFTCGHCGFAVIGNGFTNHCPECLWSRHVDCYPGDRSETCRGLMEPIGIVVRNGKTSLRFRCTACGVERINRTAPEDNSEAIIEVSRLDTCY